MAGLRKDQTVEVINLHAGEVTTFKLKPFEVLVLEAWPDSTLSTLSP
jgi:hypothetical protein